MKTKIYSLQDENGRIRYIGKTIKTLKDRLTSHLYESRLKLHNRRCNWIHSVMSRGKWPSIFLIGEVEGDGCKEEIAWIKYFRDDGVDLVNATDGGEGSLGYHHSKETREKMSIALAKLSLTEARKKQLRFARSKSPGHTGFKHSEEARMKMSRLLSGRPCWWKGKVLSQKHRKKISESRKGQRISTETKKKMSISQKNRWKKKEVA